MYAFEIHRPPAVLVRSVAACEHLRAKPLVIELARGTPTLRQLCDSTCWPR